MRLWKTPERLRRIAIWLYLALPVLLLASLLARRMPWWKWRPLEEQKIWLGVIAGITALIFGILRTKRWAYASVCILGLGVTITSLGLSIRQENIGLGLFSVAFGIIAYAYIDRLGSAFESPAVSPGLSWYQSLPEPIPGVNVDWGDRKNLRLSKIDLESAFILGSFPAGAEKNMPPDLMLHYRGTKMGGAVRILTSLPSEIDSSWVGFGVEFTNTDRDTRKELSDFIEVLRGEGHVST